jgi:putative serine protease PepD
MPPRRPEPEGPDPEQEAGARRRRRLVIGGFAALALAFAAVTGALLATTLGGGGGDERAATPITVSGGSLAKTRIGSIYAGVAPGVVQVRAGNGSGTGFVIKDDGTIVTNAHVVSSAGGDRVQVIFDDSGKQVDAEILGTDQSSDLAVLKVDPSEAPRMRPLAFADSDTVQVGSPAIAIGYPLGLERTVTAGIVSGVGREIRAPNGFSIDKVIQTDAPINPGNSGGPLLDEKGRVIGVNSQIATAGSNGNVGIGFAVPSNTVREVVPKLEAGQTVARAYLGVSTAVPRTGSGALVAEVPAGGPADRAGLRAGRGSTGEGGDLIIAVDGRPVADPDDVANAVGARKPGDRVTVVVIRDGKRKSIDVTLGTRPSQVP